MNSKPEEPSEEDCCHGDCQVCVFDLYKIQLEKWSKSILPAKNLRTDLLSETKFKPFELISEVEIAPSTKLFTFQPHVLPGTTLDGILPYREGQHFFLRCVFKQIENLLVPLIEKPFGLIRGEKKLISKPYSVISDPEKEENCKFQVVIKLYENGIASRYIRTLKVGDVTYWRGPYGDFSYQPNAYRKVLMICMGTGITPMFSIARKILGNDEDLTFVELVYGVQSLEDVIFREQLNDMASFWNFKLIYCISREEPPYAGRHLEKCSYGRVNKGLIQSKINNELNILALVCGSEEFNCDMRQILLDCDVPEKKIHIF